MAQKSGFFNALLNAGVYDRTYTADDYCDNLAVVISNGVLRGANNDLQVTANGLNLTVNAGRAWIKGHYYYNDTTYNLPAITPPTGGTRIDRVVLRFDKTISVRAIGLEYLTGQAATSPVAPALTRNDMVYDICLAEITVTANAVNASVKDTRGDSELCGWVYSVSGDNSFFVELDDEFNTWFENAKNTLASVTLFKRYKWETTLGAAASAVTFNIPQYDPDTCFIEVYINGMLADDYTISSSTITFSATLIAGTEITVLAYKSIDGTGIMSVADEITELQNQYATLDGVSKFTYTATGQDDNISLSQIALAIHTAEWDSSNCTAAANAFLTAIGGLAYLQSLEADAQITIEVVGKLGVTTPAYGSGTSASRYRYFNFSEVAHTDMRVMFDFSKADTIYISCADNTNNIVFYGTDLYIRNSKVFVINNGGECAVQVVAGSQVGIISVEGCKFDVKTTGNAFVAANGTFINCEATIKSSAGNAYCFSPTSNYLIRVIGGRFLTYVTNTTTYNAAIFNIVSAQTNAVIIAQNINCPTISETGYYQEYLANGLAGKTIIDGVVSTMNSAGSYNTISNQVWLSKQY